MSDTDTLGDKVRDRLRNAQRGSLHLELAQLVDEARAAGMRSIDCHALERLLHRHDEHLRPDLLSGDQLLHR